VQGVQAENPGSQTREKVARQQSLRRFDAILNGQLIVSSSPHARSLENTKSIMLDVIIALIPRRGDRCFLFRYARSFTHRDSVTASVFFEYLYEKLLKKPVTVNDLSAVVTGVALKLQYFRNRPDVADRRGGAFCVVLV
jgi:electron transport complex protein RnfD